jgi:hypothetical protein
MPRSLDLCLLNLGNKYAIFVILRCEVYGFDAYCVCCIPPLVCKQLDIGLNGTPILKRQSYMYLSGMLFVLDEGFAECPDGSIT